MVSTSFGCLVTSPHIIPSVFLVLVLLLGVLRLSLGIAGLVLGAGVLSLVLGCFCVFSFFTSSTLSQISRRRSQVFAGRVMTTQEGGGQQRSQTTTQTGRGRDISPVESGKIHLPHNSRRPSPIPTYRFGEIPIQHVIGLLESAPLSNGKIPIYQQLQTPWKAFVFWTTDHTFTSAHTSVGELLLGICLDRYFQRECSFLGTCFFGWFLFY